MPGPSQIAWAPLPAAQLLVGPADATGPHRRSADLDLLWFDGGVGELEVRRALGPRGLPSLDLIRLPAALLHDASAVACMGLVTHRVVAGRAAQAGSAADALRRAVQAQWQLPQARRARVAGFLEMVRLTVREVGAAADCPPLARFFLQMAHAALMAAVLDAAGRACPNIYTRAPRYAPAAGALLRVPLAQTLPAALGLGGHPAALEAPLMRLQRLARQRCPSPDWPAAIRGGTRAEFAYWRAPAEITSRIAAARAMAAEGDTASAVFYLRYAAWSLVRLAMVYQRATEGHAHHVSFIRPERAVLPDLVRHHLPLVAPWLAVFDASRAFDIDCAGARVEPCDAAAVDAALAHLNALRAPMAAHLARCATDVPLADWRPWAPPDTPGASPMAAPPSPPSTTAEEAADAHRARPVEPAV